MGMAASQANFLFLTARMHDIELKAQRIQADKIALATQEDLVYQQYCDAMDATNIAVQYQDGLTTKLVDANFSSLCTYNENRTKDYAIRDNTSGKIIVSEEVKQKYENFKNDKYSFAWAMLGFEGCFGWNDPYMGEFIGIGTNQDKLPEGYVYGTDPDDDGNNGDLYMTEVEADVYEKYKDSDDKLANKYQDILDAEDDKTKQTALNEFRKYLYSNKYFGDIFDKMNADKNDYKDDSDSIVFEDTEWDDVQEEFNYYIHQWEAITEAGGCQAVDPQFQSGEDGTTWFNNMVNSGSISIMVFGDTGHKNEWSDTTVATSTNNNYLQNQPDKVKQKKAEVKYEHDLREIDRKDSQYDTELSNLETERSAIKTEMDSIKTARNDNIERTFNIFN